MINKWHDRYLVLAGQAFAQVARRVGVLSQLMDTNMSAQFRSKAVFTDNELLPIWSFRALILTAK
jgi:hypothetical protein